MPSTLLRRRLAAALLALAGVPLAAAAPAPVPAAVQAHPALWRITRGPATVWLFGTIHALPAGYRWRNPALDAVIAQARTLVIEAKLGDGQAVATDFLNMATPAAKPPPLRERVPARDRRALAAAVAKSPVPAKALDGMKTWAAGFELVGVTLADLGVSGDAGVETTLQQAFKADGRPIEAFESAKQQFGFFDALPERAQRSFLVSVVADPEDRSDYTKMLAAWGRGDEAAIARSFDKDLKGSQGLRDMLVTHRNALWADAIAQRLAVPGATLVAVGAGHLAGAQSVQHLLEAKGIKVERIE